MSGNAALSAARKRRASSTPTTSGGGGGGGGVGFANSAPSQSASGSYYGGGSSSKNSIQGIMNQMPYPPAPRPEMILPKETAPNVPTNIYENIELIKQQLSERTKLIQTHSSSIPADKLRVLQKQNEIQNQILKQKIAIAQQMTNVEQQRQQEQKQLYAATAAQRQANNAQSTYNTNEPEFIYEKGIPRKNPRYRKPDEPNVVVSPAQVSNTPQQMPPQQMPYPSDPDQTDRKLSPFISMISDTGVIPPPIVILKSHDAKIEEHHYIIQDMLEQLDYLHSNMNSEQLSTIKEESIHRQYAPVAGMSHMKDSAINDADADADADAGADADADEETELLMDVVMRDLTNSREFVEGIVDKIVNETNLAEVIMKIEPVIKENQELRALIHSQQQMMNEMNTTLFRLLNQQNAVSNSSSSHSQSSAESQSCVYNDEGLNGDGLYPAEITEIVLTPSVSDSNEEQQATLADVAVDEAVPLQTTVADVEAAVVEAVVAVVDAVEAVVAEVDAVVAVAEADAVPVAEAVEAVEAEVEADAVPVAEAVPVVADTVPLQTADEAIVPEPIALVVSEL